MFLCDQLITACSYKNDPAEKTFAFKIAAVMLTDIDECGSNPCLNNGKCKDLIDKYTCECVGGYTGDRCQSAPTPTTGG